MPNRQQDIIWANDDPVQQCIYASLGHNEFLSIKSPNIYPYWTGCCVSLMWFGEKVHFHIMRLVSISLLPLIGSRSLKCHVEPVFAASVACSVWWLEHWLKPNYFWILKLVSRKGHFFSNDHSVSHCVQWPTTLVGHIWNNKAYPCIERRNKTITFHSICVHSTHCYTASQTGFRYHNRSDMSLGSVC